MADTAYKETRRRLRRVQDHLTRSNLNLGARREAVGLVDVIYHPDNTTPYLNYVTPRKNTAWVPGDEIDRGLDFLRERGLMPRVHYIEGLFPPVFAKTLRALNLKVERETPVMVYQAPDHPRTVMKPALPSEVTIAYADDQRGIALWWYVWRNAYYDVYATGVEPLFVGRDMRETFLGNQIDILLFRHGFPLGVARLTLHDDETAHIMALALLQEARTPEMTRALYAAATSAALDRGCSLVFTAGESEDDRRLCRELGFVDSGSIVCYAERLNKAHGATDDTLAQPVFVLR